MTLSPPRYALAEHRLRPRQDRVWTIFSVNVRLRGLRIFPLLLVGFGFVATFVPLFLTELFSTYGLSNGPSLASFYSAYNNLMLFIFTLLMSAVVGSGIIADDLRTKSISLYLSRPITVLDYLVGKSGVVGALLALLAILPGVLTAVLVGVLGYVSATVAAEAIGIYLGTGVLLVLVLTGFAVLLSSLTERKSFAGAGIFAVLLSLEIVASVLYAATNQVSALYLAPWEDVLSVARWGFGVRTPEASLDPSVALSILIVLPVVLYGATYVRLRRLEVMTE